MAAHRESAKDGIVRDCFSESGKESAAAALVGSVMFILTVWAAHFVFLALGLE